MYRLIATKFGVKDFVRDFEEKMEAKAAAQEDIGKKKLKWKVLTKKRGRKKRVRAVCGQVEYTIKKIKVEEATEIPPKVDRNYFQCDNKGCGDNGVLCIACEADAAIMDDPRTVREFVEDLLSAGRTPGMVLGVAQSCRWDRHLPAVKAVLEEFSKN